MLATYTGFPTAEYLRVDGQDLATFNVFLERAEQLAPYLRHLQRVTGTFLVLTELGLAAELHDDGEQARSLKMQLDLVDESGCAGATIFSWTDEWASPAGPIEGWGFGLTRADRSPRPSLEVAARWCGRKLRDVRPSWPSVSVVVCAYNEERRIGECLDSLARVDYPALQVVVCDDGSTDRTLELARRSPFQVLPLPHGGLSAARNAGLSAATGDIVAYLDADAACHPEWPYHLALAFDDPGVVVAGGPNLPFPGAGLVERAVALSLAARWRSLSATTEPSTSPAATWPSDVRPCRASAASTPPTRRLETTSTSAGGCWTVVVRSPSAQLPRSTTTDGTRCAGTCASSAATAELSACLPVSTGTGSTGGEQRAGPASCTAVRASCRAS